MRILIVGAGEVGYHVAERLAKEHHDVVVIDVDRDRLDYVESHLDVAVVEGSGVNLTVLETAGVSQAGVLLAVTVFALLAIIADRGAPSGVSGDLAPGETEVLRARVVEVLEEGTLQQGDFSQPYQHLMLRITNGALAGQEIVVEHGVLVVTNQDRLFQVGDQVLVDRTRTMDGYDVFQVTDHVRTRPLLWLALLFVVATLLLSRTS